MEYDELIGESIEETSAQVKARADRARKIQRERLAMDGISSNAEMNEKQTREYCKLDEQSEEVLRDAFERLQLSARARSRILKVARTIADLELSETILPEHIYEAVSYRTYGVE